MKKRATWDPATQPMTPGSLLEAEPWERCDARDDRNPQRQCARPAGHVGPHDCGYSFVIATEAKAPQAVTR